MPLADIETDHRIPRGPQPVRLRIVPIMTGKGYADGTRTEGRHVTDMERWTLKLWGLRPDMAAFGCRRHALQTR
jgi:hypothetical protein